MDRNILCPRSIRYLLAVAKHQSFTKAAEALFVSQPTLSQQIKSLEEELDVQLLDRSGRAVHLTDAGEVYSGYARRALGELDAGKRAIHELQDLSRGLLRLGTTPITEHLAAPLLDNFSNHYPGITLSTLEMSQDEIQSGLAEDRIDMGIAFTNSPSSETDSREINAQTLFIQPLVLVVGENHPHAGRETPLSSRELHKESLALLNTNFTLRRHIDLYCLEHDIAPRISFESNSLSVIVEIVRLGRLATILPCTIASGQEGLNPVMLVPDLPHHTITLVCRKGAYRSPACMAFAKMAGEWSDTKWMKSKSKCKMDEFKI